MHLASFVVAIDQNWMFDYAVLTAATRGMTALGRLRPVATGRKRPRTDPGRSD